MIGMFKTIYMHNIGVDKANNGPTNCTKTFGFNFLGNLYTHPKVIFHWMDSTLNSMYLICLFCWNFCCSLSIHNVYFSSFVFLVVCYQCMTHALVFLCIVNYICLIVQSSMCHMFFVCSSTIACLLRDIISCL